MAHALVLGATGHIGAHIVRALLAAGHAVRAAYRTPGHLSVLDGLPVERVRTDLAALAGLDEALLGCEWVFHAAGYYPGPRASRAQALGEAAESTRRILTAVGRARPSRIVFTSSAATIRTVAGRLATEEDAEAWPPATPRSLYAAVKIRMEQEALRAAREGLPLVAVNPSVCIGEYDSRPFSGRLVLLFAKHRVPWYVDHVLDAVYTGDVGVGHVRAAERGRTGERYLLTGQAVNLRDFAILVARAAGGRAPRWRVPTWALQAAATLSEAIAWASRREPLLPRAVVRGLRQGQWLDGSKARRELGMPHTPLEEAIRRALTWFRTHGYCS